MLQRHELETREIALDACIDRMVSGGDWQAALPADGEARRDIISLLGVALKLVEYAKLQVAPAAEVKARTWQRINASPEMARNRGLFRRLAAFRVLYTPPMRPSVVERVLFARVPGVPPLFVRFAEAS